MDELFKENATACEVCDWINPVPPMYSNQRLSCQRCEHTLLTVQNATATKLVATCLATLIMFGLSLYFSFMGFSSNGASQNISLLDSVNVLLVQHFTVLGAVVALTLLVLPALYLLSILYVAASLLRNHKPRFFLRWLLLTSGAIKPWLMGDVFLLASLVAVVKLHSLADIHLGLSFWAYCVFTLMLLKVICYADKRWLWNQCLGPSPKLASINGDSAVSGTAQSQQLAGCKFCGALNPADQQHCQRCQHVIRPVKRNLSNTLALLIAATVLYIPANLYPIMNTTFLGSTEHSTIIGGVLLLWALKSYPVAALIFIASVLVPICKILALFWLCWQRFRQNSLTGHQKQRVHHITEIVGRWSMIDIFVVAILSALVQLGALMNIVPGSAAVCFCAVVILTMLAAMSLDSRTLWE